MCKYFGILTTLQGCVMIKNHDVIQDMYTCLIVHYFLYKYTNIIINVGLQV